MRRVWLFSTLLIALALALTSACGDDGDVVSGPSAIVIQLEGESVHAGESIEAVASYVYLREDEPDCLWYVDDVLGGSAELGTITQDNPATYTAPLMAPAGGQVEIKAVSDDGNEWEDSASLNIEDPIGVELSFSAMQCQVADQIEVEASLSWGERSGDVFDWYVDGVLGGNAMSGTITQGNPAVYTAPSAVPAGGSVEIAAAYRADDEIAGSAEVQVLFTIKYVDAAEGADVVGAGAWNMPFRTISYALDEAAAGDTVQVAPGTYDGDHGEDDVITVPEDVTLRGSSREEVFVYGGEGQYYSLELRSGATLESITLGNAGVASGGELSSIGIFTSSTAGIRDVRINDTFDYSAIRIDGTGNETLVEGCEIVNTSHPGWDRGFELVFGSSAILRDCTVSGWNTGLFCNTTSDPLIEDCVITDNNDGITAYSGSGEPPPVTNPDLGGGARGSLGGNVIQDNTNYGLYVRNEEGTIYALDNSWNSDPPTEGPPAPADFYREHDTAIVWQ